MKTDRELIQQALKMIRSLRYRSLTDVSDEIISALEERLAQPEQEPVAWLDGPHLVVRLDMRNRLNYQGPWVDLGRAIPDKWTPFLYTTPPQRTWVDLTDEEIDYLYVEHRGDGGPTAICEQFARAVLAKAKEKNT